MSWTYTSSPTTSDLDAIRLLTGDTDSAYPLLQDEEINYFLSTYSSVTEAAAYTCEAIAAKFARMVTWSGDGLSVSVGDLQDKYSRMAEDLRQQFRQGEAKVAGPSAAVLDRPYLPIWRLRQHDNPEAGKQWALSNVWYDPLKAQVPDE